MVEDAHVQHDQAGVRANYVRLVLRSGERAGESQKNEEEVEAKCLTDWAHNSLGGTMPERGQTARLIQFYRDAAVFPVPGQVFRRISEDVLVAEFDSDLGRDVGQVVQILNGEMAPAGHGGQLAEQSGAGQLFRGPPSVGHRFEDAHGIELRVGLAQQVADLAFGIAAGVVAAIGNHQQRAASGSCPCAIPAAPCRCRRATPCALWPA